MKKKSKIPVVYMLVCIYMIFSAFDLLENSDVSPAQKMSYVFLILVPLGLIILSVWQRNTRLEFHALPATAMYTPFGILSILIGVGAMFGPVFGFDAMPSIVCATLFGIVGLAIAFLGFNRIRNLTAATTLVGIDVPESEAKKIQKRLPYEKFPKFNLLSETAGREPVHVVLNRDPLAFGALKEKHRLVELHGESPKEVPAQYKDPDRFWCGAAVNPIAVAINPVAWKKARGEEPDPIQSLETLLSPNLAGSFTMPDPEHSAAGYVFLAGLAQKLGEEEALEFMANLKKQAYRLLPDPINYAEVFADPERVVAVGFLQDLLAARTMHLNLMVCIPDGVGWELLAAAIPQESPSREAAHQFMETLLGRRGNEVFASKCLMLPTHPQALLPFGCRLPEEGGPNLDFDMRKALAERDELLRKWRSR